MELVEQLSDKEIIDKLLQNDNQAFEYYFFDTMCTPLLSKIRWSVFDNEIELCDIRNEFLILLKNDDWQKLRSFGFRCTLFRWLKIVALNHFHAIKDDLLPNKYANKQLKGEEIFVPLEKDLEFITFLNKLVTPIHKEIMWRKLIARYSDAKIQTELNISKNLYKELLKKANNSLIGIIKNEGEFFEAMFIVAPKKSSVEIEPVVDNSSDAITAKIDVDRLLKLVPNERYRTVLDSLFLKGCDRKHVAEMLGTTVQNVDILKCRAIKQLTEIIRREK